MKKLAFGIAAGALTLYVAGVGILYLIQERLIFYPQKLDKSHRFAHRGDFEELSFPTTDGAQLNGLLFKAGNPKGLIFYLHGNSGSLASWGDIAHVYTDLQYDLFMLDYRGFGKSEGVIGSEDQLHSDVQMVYDSLKTRYKEQDIIILGYSIGTGPAARLASVNDAGMLILQAPYYNMTGVMRELYPAVPTFILRYRLETNNYIKACKMPVVIFHGDRDEVIKYSASMQLKELLKPADTLIILKGQRHGGMSDNPEYRAALSMILSR